MAPTDASTPRRGVPISQRARGRGRQTPNTPRNRSSTGTSVDSLATRSTNNSILSRQAATSPASSGASFFPGSHNLDIAGGSFVGAQHGSVVTINVTQGGNHETDSNPNNEHTPMQYSRTLDDEEYIPINITAAHDDNPMSQSWATMSSLPTMRSSEIYFKQLLVKKRGSPLWVPAPNTKLPLSYRRKGISIGDVGIITDYGGFDFLFSMCLPVGHPDNSEDLPEEFAPLDPPLKATDIRGYSDFRPNSYLASSSVKKTRRADDDPSGLTFESSDREGAILTMPNGTKSEDLGNRMRVERYASSNLDRWYRYAHEVRGREAENGDLHVVIGWDQSTTWGMAAFSNRTTSQNAFRVKFRPNRRPAGQGGMAQVYDWECDENACEGKAGPDERELEELRAGDPGEAGVVYENQCLFVRTLNIFFNDDIFEKLKSDTGMGQVFAGQKTTNPSPSIMPTSPNLGSSSANQQTSSVFQNDPGTIRRANDPSGIPQALNVSQQPSSLAIHPSKYVSKRLLNNSKSARMVITGDEVWTSILRDNETVMPDEDELYERIMLAYDIVEEDGCIFLEPKEKKDDPPWLAQESSITEEETIGISHLFETVRGTFTERDVAITRFVVEPNKSTLRRALDLWTELAHPNVLSTYAGSLSSPCFYITPYMEGGNLVQYLKEIDNKSSRQGPYGLQPGPTHHKQGSIDAERSRNRLLLGLMYEISLGMEYLHSQGILHGALEASKILMDENSACVISDFGQTAIRRECGQRAEDIPSSSSLNDDYVRWSSPELLREGNLTDKADVWAFSITCVEILTMGGLPWPLLDNDAVKTLLLTTNSRPTIPKTQSNVLALEEIISACWKTSPSERPSYVKITKDLQHIRLGSPARSKSTRSSHQSHSSASMRAISIEIPSLAGISLEALASPKATSVLSIAVYNRLGSSETPLSPNYKVDLELPSDDESEDDTSVRDVGLSRIERRYRFFLNHKYKSSLVMPLWTPSMVRIGAVGYLKKPGGSFTTLFNAFYTKDSKNDSIEDLPSLDSYGGVKLKLTKPDKKSYSKRILRKIPGVSSLGTSPVSFPLGEGSRISYLHAENTEYRYMETLDGAKRWLEDYSTTIYDAYRPAHNISAEDIVLVTGTLETSHYALLVNHSFCPHDGEVTFKPNRSLKKTEPWGTFSVDDKLAPYIATNVSPHDGPQKTVLIARLRIGPDSNVATSK